MGIGNLLMSGCFGTGYQENDPCYKLAVPLSRCSEQLDAANFIGVGFDVTKSYTSESRYSFLISRYIILLGFVGENAYPVLNKSDNIEFWRAWPTEVDRCLVRPWL